MITEEIKEQWKRPIDEFKWNVKCCYNCPNWMRDPMLIGDYAYNHCYIKKNTMTAWDGFCEHYCGVAREENLINGLSKEEKQYLEEVIE